METGGNESMNGLVGETVEPCDVLIIGGGPAGATAACLLAEQGRDTVLLEKAEHPRFHIGESLLPRNMEIIDRLGLREAVAAIGVFKPGAEFVSDATGETIAFDFSKAIGTTDTAAYQVVRSEFDALLFAEARRRGARAWERTLVTDVQPAGVDGRLRVTATDQATGRARQFAPRFVLDASGRDTFMASRLQTKRSSKKNNTAAVFAHYRGVDMRRGDREGYITVHLADDGWFWMIPLPNDVMSVGFVGTQRAFKDRRASMDAFFDTRLRTSPTVSARMEHAERISAVTAAGNYSYEAQTSWGENYMLVGDAFAFVDPVFSSGVLLAMTSGEMAAGVAAAWIDNPARGRAMARRAERTLRGGMRRISWLIYRINSPVLRDMFLAPSNRLRMRDGLIALLSGNLRQDPALRLPVLAFKGAYYMLSVLSRLGIRPVTTST
jgi:flavin-dependent dehydrogenase